MKRIASLIALGFVVLTASTYYGVILGERKSLERRAEYFARKVMNSLAIGSPLAGNALPEAEVAQLRERSELFVGRPALLASELEGDEWHLDYCTQTHTRVRVRLPEPNPDWRARIEMRADEPPC